jgi:hypothetical protein
MYSNEQTPTPAPAVNQSARSLPPAAFGYGFSAHSQSRSGGGSGAGTLPGPQVHTAPAPPRILQRPKNVAPGVHSDGTQVNKSNSANEHKTVEQRQEAYRLARERIFGPSKPSNKSKVPCNNDDGTG